MDSFTIHARNTFGIGELEHVFKVRDSENGKIGSKRINSNIEHRCFEIYAPNGTCKTSLCKAIERWSQSGKQEDCFFRDRSSEFDITTKPGGAFSRDHVICFRSMRDLESANLFADGMLASKDLKQKYQKALKVHADSKDYVLNSLRFELKTQNGLPKLDDMERLVTEAGGCESFDESLEKLRAESDGFVPPQFMATIKMNALLSSKTLDILGKPDVKSSLKDYSQVRDEMLSKSHFLRDGFDYSSARALAKELAKDHYFDAGHKLTLLDSANDKTIEVASVDELNDLIGKSLNAVDADPAVKAKFAGVENALRNTTAAEDLRNKITNQPEIAAALSDPNKLQHDYFVYAVSHCTETVDDYLNGLNGYQETVRALEKDIMSESTEWDEAVKLFKSRFDVPYNLSIVNKAAAVVRGDLPEIHFDYDGHEIEKETLFANLSDGECKALYMLDIFFEVQRARRLRGPKLLVFDDVVDSFDTFNKYAFIEYLRDFASDPNTYVLLLTHNFSFFQTVGSRLSTYFGFKDCLLAEKSNEGKISLNKFAYLKNAPLVTWRKCLEASKKNANKCNNAKTDTDVIKIAAIPMVRELVSIKEDQDPDYKTLSAVLHGRPDGCATKFSELSPIIKNYLNCDSYEGDERQVQEVIEHKCDELVRLPDPWLPLEQKIVIALGIRIAVERYILGTYKRNSNDWPDTKMLGKLVNNKFKNDFPQEFRNHEDLLERAVIITPESIHLNSLNYESLVDVGSMELKDLYRECQELGHVFPEAVQPAGEAS